MAMIRPCLFAVALVATIAPDTAAQVSVRFRGITTANAALTLFDGWRNGTCRTDELRPVPVWMVLQFGTVDPVHAGCELEFVALARGRRPFVVTTALLADFLTGPLSGLWTTAVELKMRLPESPRIQVWVADFDGTPGWIEDMRHNANSSLHYGRVGLKPSWHTEDLTANSGAVGLLAGGCARAGDIRRAGHYRADALNIYVSDFQVDGLPSTKNGHFCGGSGADDMMFVKPWGPIGIMGHEIGHALSLLHTDGLAGFAETNLMYEFVWEPAQLAVGQVYRMQFDDASWLNRASVVASRPLVKDCQLPPGPGLCPSLSLGMTSW